jgi:hypothetical protein
VMTLVTRRIFRLLRIEMNSIGSAFMDQGTTGHTAGRLQEHGFPKRMSKGQRGSTDFGLHRAWATSQNRSSVHFRTNTLAHPLPP